jgi:hypothetical protein
MDKYSLYRGVRKVITFPRRVRDEIVFAYQRVTRGFSDRDWWSIDSHIANILSQALPKYVKDGHGISSSYLPKGYGESGDSKKDDADFAKAIKKRDAEYSKYADIFARYYNGGIWHNEESAKEFDGITEPEYKAAVAWLAKNFSGLWD